jgi:hypothetical protein
MSRNEKITVTATDSASAMLKKSAAAKAKPTVVKARPTKVSAAPKPGAPTSTEYANLEKRLQQAMKTKGRVK